MTCALLAAAMLLAAASCPVEAQAVHGFYLQGNTGIFFQKTQPLETTPAGTQSQTDLGAAQRAGAAITDTPGANESGSVGYGFGKGLRVEIQGMHAGATQNSP